MQILTSFIIVVFILHNFQCGTAQQLLQRNRFKRLPAPSGLKLKRRLYEKLNQYRQRNTQVICYDIVGCFELPHRRSPLQKIPEDPAMLDTKFYLFTKHRNFSQPEILKYDDNGKSLNETNFNPSLPLKLIVHGYLGKWTDIGPLIGAETYLKVCNCNVVLIDWSTGARGPHYAVAAANTEVIGRQLGILLLNMVNRGLKPEMIHLLGFSLGAHIAGSSSEVLKHEGHLIGRISGLDAASPLFKTNHLREKHKKLDREDARLVDVVHTDASPSITDGFGLWEPVGHVDYFPNGGQEQPGCTDTRQSIVVSHFDRSLTRDIACSHIRAWRLFQETLADKIIKGSDNCEFVAFSCPGGLKSFERGHCFPSLPKRNGSLTLDPNYRSEIGRFGEDVKGEGVMFFVTKDSPPYCGTQLQASVHISPKTGAMNGDLLVTLHYNNYSVNFYIKCETSDFIMTGTVMSGLGVADYKSLDEVHIINTTLKFTNLEYEENNTYVPIVYIDKISVRDMYSNSWQYCGRETMLEEEKGGSHSTKTLKLTKNLC